MRCLPVNLNSFLVELDSLDEVLALHQSLLAKPIAAISELIPAARTLFIYFDRRMQSAKEIAMELRQRDLTRGETTAGNLITIPVSYDGEDLDFVAQHLDITTDEVIRRHTQSRYQVAFTGFAPGFAYMVNGESQLHVPRRSSPRVKIPQGAVALAGEFSGIYPKDSPGGWQLIGHTNVAMWDLTRSVPALLQPGDEVQFISETAKTVIPLPQNCSVGSKRTEGALEVVSPGLWTTFQDIGRFGQAGMGVSESGAMDQLAFRQANQLVGNAPNQACLELTQGGLQLKAHQRTTMALTGALGRIDKIALDGSRTLLPSYQSFELEVGEGLKVAMATHGVRGYLAVRGGFAEDKVLASCSYDSLAQIGPEPLTVGDYLTLGDECSCVAEPLDHPLKSVALACPKDTVTLDIVLGPHSDWFSSEAILRLQQQSWKVTPQSNRIGLRLSADQPLERVIEDELPSEGTGVGAIEIPANGQPVLFMRDHPLTGGYPVIASVAEYHLDKAGQLPAGVTVRFKLVQPFSPF